MARIRSIKPEFWTDEKIVECSTSARLFFIGLWNFADDYGNIQNSAKQLKAKIFPCDNIKVDQLINELITQRLLVEYSSNDCNYLHINNFEKHQKIDRPSSPACPEYTACEYSSSTRRGLALEGKGEEGKGEEGNIGSIEDSSTASVNTKTKFLKPNLDDIKNQILEKEPIQIKQAEIFFNHYEANGWIVGKTPMKNWQAALSNWLARCSQYKSPTETTQERNIRKIEAFQ